MKEMPYVRSLAPERPRSRIARYVATCWCTESDCPKSENRVVSKRLRVCPGNCCQYVSPMLLNWSGISHHSHELSPPRMRQVGWNQSTSAALKPSSRALEKTLGWRLHG